MTGPHLCLVVYHPDQRGTADGEPLGMDQKVVPWLLRQERDGDAASKGFGGQVRIDVEVIVRRGDSFWQTETVLPWPLRAPGHGYKEHTQIIVHR